MTDSDLLIDLHARNPRQAPGSDEETRRALALARLHDRARLDVADMGCGTGGSTLVLARALDAHITAIDAAPAFVEHLRSRAEKEGLGSRITARTGNMESPGFDEESLDLIWSEGAIYNIGFERGVRDWYRLLRPGGVLCVSELSWTTRDRPSPVQAYWTGEYPGISTPCENLATLERSGYAPLGCFFLPGSCWEQEYFTPLRAGFDGFLERHAGSETASRIVQAERDEMRLYERFGAYYGYAFYIAQRPDSAEG
ncbi:MAG: class I SAM-dependent methyltransferase [Phycisphaerales bacterium]